VRLPIRRAARPSGRPPIRRASAGMSAARIGAGVVAIAMAAAIYGVVVSPAFALGRVEVSGDQYTSEDAVRAALGIGADAHPNLFALDTARLRAALLKLPAVTDAEVTAILPDRLEVRLIERVPVLVWRIGATRYLVDADGIVVAAFASPASGTAAGAGASSDPGATGSAPAGGAAAASPSAAPRPSASPRAKPSPTVRAAATLASGAAGSASPGSVAARATGAPSGPASGPAASGAPAASVDPEGLALPTFIDERSKSQSLAPGASLDPTDLAVARLLGALTPKAIGSKAPQLRITITDRDGFAIDAGTGRWRAVFGMYTATLRSPDLIPAQVQCLRSVLGTGESKLQVVYLFPDGDQCGTFMKKPST